MTTTCELTTYTPTPMLDIPLSRTSLSRKIILKSPLLHDAILELASSSSSQDSLLTITSSPTAPFFTLASASPLGSTVVEFSNDRDLLETFQVPVRSQSSYRFALVRYAVRAMAVASKVSIRGDGAGVLSLQFMVEWEGKASFIDFRFLPVEEGEEEAGGDGDGDGDGDEDGGEE
jgi:cell cycle checkpoint protein